MDANIKSKKREFQKGGTESVFILYRKVKVKVINDFFNNFSKDYGVLRSELVIRKWQQEVYTTFMTYSYDIFKEK